jgi:hypothetical protein
MNLPDCYDPANQADALQEEFDRKCKAYPRCTLCGQSLYTHDTYTMLNNHRYCDCCIENNTHPTERLEVDL